MRIWKWPLEDVTTQEILAPQGAKFLDAQVQGGVVCLWGLCDERAPKEPRTIWIYGTGAKIPDEPGEYIATFQMYDGALVFHVFEGDI